LSEQKLKLPKGWANSSVEIILSVLENGARPKGGVKKITEGIPSIGGEHLSYNGKFNFKKIKFIPKLFFDSMTKGKIKESDILIVKDGATTGKVSLIKKDFPYEKSAVNEHVFIIRGTPEIILQEFLFYFLFSSHGQDHIKKKSTGLIGGINTSFVKDFQILLPPLNEQKRIVSKIEKLFSDLDNVRDTLQKVKLQLGQYRQSLLKSAFDGKLTEEWRKKNPCDKKITKNNNLLPNAWDFVPLIEIADINPIKSKNTVDDNLDISFLPMKCVEELTGKYDLSNIKKYGEVKKGYTFFKNLDIIFAKITPCMENGKIAIVNELKNGMGFGSTEFHVIRLKEDKMSRQFYFYYLIQDNFRDIAQRNMKGTAGQLRVSSDYMKNILVPMIPFEEQEQVVIEINQKFSLIENVENITNSMLKKLETLRSSILKQAFEGKLVTQNSKEESVQKLLEKIKKKKNLC
jgi:type I restriction enzyme, S subunit